tara:strand:- start:106 stop:450 length:345 start_codon:yes stop_codon:yes gene_type:complete
VATLVGLPPTPWGLDRFLRTAEARCALVMRPAVAAGTHLGYLRLPLFFEPRPHFSKPPPFLGAPISTQSSLNHFVRLISVSFQSIYRRAFYILEQARLKRKLTEKHQICALLPP